MNNGLSEAEKFKIVSQIWADFVDETQVTQATAARVMGLSQSALCQYLRGHISLNTDFLLAFCRLTGTNPATFLPDLAAYIDPLEKEICELKAKQDKADE